MSFFPYTGRDSEQDQDYRRYDDRSGFLVDKPMLPYIHKNARVSIGTEGLMGNKIINILPVNESAPPVREGDLLTASQALSTDEMLQTLDRTNTNIADISEDLKVRCIGSKRVKRYGGSWMTRVWLPICRPLWRTSAVQAPMSMR